MQDLIFTSIDSELKSQQITISERSYLYYLKPQSGNSAYIESLTGYVARLAQTHHVFPGTLMESIIAPLINKEYGGANLHRIYSHTSALNGTGTMALDLVQALHSLTLQNELRLLTMLPWAEVMPTRHLLRSNRAWCPLCYEEWRSTQQVVYDPLIWVLEVVKVCALHQQPLVQKCPHCDRSNLPLAWKSRPGYCSKCQSWLGSPCRDLQLSTPKKELEWEIWVAQVIGELLAAAPNLKSFPTSQRIANALHFYVDRVADGNAADFARQLGIPKNTFWLWLQGKNLPTLESVLRICYGLKISFVNFLVGDILASRQDQPILLPTTSQPPKRKDARVFDADYLQHLQQRLQEYLESDDLPPLSMKQIGKRLGHDRRTICRHFGELCHAISVKYDSYQQACYLEAVEQACREVQCIVPELMAQSLYPSEARVSELMSKPGYLRYDKVRAALREARIAMGLK